MLMPDRITENNILFLPGMCPAYNWLLNGIQTTLLQANEIDNNTMPQVLRCKQSSMPD